MNIRACRADDAAEFRQLVIELQDTLRPLDRDLLPGTDAADEYIDWLRRNVAESSGAIWVADTGTELAGYACVFGLVDPDEPDEVKQRFSYLADLYVREAYRLDGVGSRLMQTAEDFARGLGAFKLELSVLVRNRGAVNFYERHGYAKRFLCMSKRL